MQPSSWLQTVKVSPQICKKKQYYSTDTPKVVLPCEICLKACRLAFDTLQHYMLHIGTAEFHCKLIHQ